MQVQHLTEPMQFRVRATPLARMIIWAIGSYGIIQGLLILVLSSARFSGGAYAIVVTAPGGYKSWGVAALILGGLVVLASALRNFILKAIGLIGLAVWSMSFAGSLLVAAITTPTVGTTGIPTYILIAVCAAAEVWVDERKVAWP